MAQQGIGKLFSVVGAGYAGAMLYNNGEAAANFGSAVGRSLLRSIAKADAPSSLPDGASDDAMRRLSAEVAALSALVSGAALRSGVTASAAAPSSAVSNALVLGGVGALGAAVLLRVGGLGMDEVMYVSRATFKSGVATLGGGLQSVTAALGRVRAALSERIDALTSRVEEGLAQQEALARVAAETHDGVGALCEQMGAVEGKLDGVQAKQDFACRGIYLLCSVVSQTIKDGGGAQAQAGHDARGFAKLAPAGAAAANSGSASLLELLGANPPASAAATPHLAPLTGTVQEQLAAISSLAAINCQLEAPTVQAR